MLHGCYESGYDCVLELLVDDGVYTKENRRHLLDARFGKVGVGVAKAVRSPWARGCGAGVRHAHEGHTHGCSYLTVVVVYGEVPRTEWLAEESVCVAAKCGDPLWRV